MIRGAASLKRPRPSRLRVAAVALVASSLLSCETVEKVLPYAIVAGGAIASVVALNYLSDCTSDWAVCEADPFTDELVPETGYTEQVLLMIGTLTTVGGAAADYWAEHREKQRELARLEEVQQQVDSQYQALQNGPPPPPVQGWGAGPPAAGAYGGGETRWGNAYAAAGPQGGWVQSAPHPQGAYPPTGGYPPQGAPPQGYPPQGYPPQGYPPQGYPPQGPPPQGYPPQGPPPQGYPPQGYGPPPGQSPWGAPPPPTAPRSVSAEPIALETALLKRAGDRAVPIPDHDILFDGIGESIRDEFRVLFSPNQDAHVYVVGIDAVGRAQPLFPTQYPDRSNPIRAGEKVMLPGGERWYGLDRYTGLQHIYFYVSLERDELLEKQLTLFAATPPPEPGGADGQIYYVSSPTLLQHSRTRGRGILKPEEGEPLRIPGDTALEVPTLRVQATAPNEPLVVTRVFQHQ